MLIIITGVSGTGKTTIGKLLSKSLNIPYFDADDFHSAANIEKMSNGIPLNDEDRMPWLKAMAAQLIESSKTGGAVLGCSALKEKYREILEVNESVKWIHLEGSRELILERMKHRENHYMKPEMLDSQLATWQEPSYGYKLSIDQTPKEMLEEALEYLKEKR